MVVEGRNGLGVFEESKWADSTTAGKGKLDKRYPV